MEFKQERIGLYLATLLAAMSSVHIVLSIVKGGLMNYLQVIILLLPVIFIVILNTRRHWHVMFFAFIASNSLVIPIYGLEKFDPLFLALGVTSIVTLLDHLMHRSAYKIKFDMIDRFVMVLALLVTGRLIHDRPGFVALGASDGGLMTGLRSTLPFWYYFTIQVVVATAKLTRKQLIFIGSFAAFMIVWAFFFAPHIEGVYIGRRLTNAPTWQFVAILLTLYATSSKKIRRNLHFYILSLATLVGGIISGYRSRIFFFFAEILMIAIFIGKFKRVLLILFTFGVLGIGGMLVSGHVPAAASRVLSLFTTVNVADKAQMGGAMGWQDNFRLKLMQYAWVDMKEKPWLGHGFGLDVKQAVGILSVFDQETQIEFLALSRSYHNSVLAFAVWVGIPCALIFVFVSIIIPYRFYKLLRKAPEGDLKSWSIAIMAFWSANLGMLLMNGGARELFACMVLNGLMQAIYKTKADELTVDSGQPTVTGIDMKVKQIAQMKR